MGKGALSIGEIVAALVRGLETTDDEQGVNDGDGREEDDDAGHDTPLGRAS